MQWDAGVQQDGDVCVSAADGLLVGARNWGNWRLYVAVQALQDG
jgi:hypothetical protein